MMKSIINIQQDSYQDIDSAILNNYIAERYTFPVVGLQCTHENFDYLLNALKTQYKVDVNEFNITQTNRTYYIEEKENKFLFIVNYESSNYYTVSIFTDSVKTSSEMYNMFKKYEHTDEGAKIVFKTTSLSNGRLEEGFSRLQLTDFKDDIDEYYPYLDVEELFTQFIESNENILVLFGPPGVGKTRLANLFMKFMLQNTDLCIENKMIDEEMLLDSEVLLNVSYVKNEDVLSNDSYWNNLSNIIYSMVFLDDADFCLTNRKNEALTQEDHNKNKFLSQLLSFTDGINKSGTKFIVTTNLGVDDIDAAVLRKGRTFDILNLRYLKEDEALEIWKLKQLDEKRYYDYIPEGDVPACDLGSAINTETNRVKKGQELKSYIKEDGISILNKSKKEKNVGFF